MQQRAIWKDNFLNMGTLSPYPWDLTLYGKNGRFGSLVRLRRSARPLQQTAWGDGAYPSPPFPRLSRRSGRIPALPYPPLSSDQYSREAKPTPGRVATKVLKMISACELSTLTNNTDLPDLKLIGGEKWSRLWGSLYCEADQKTEN
jgi:hypothetical protein